MSNDKPLRVPPKPTTRARILDAAERLLGQGDAAFSMRDLAEEAGVSFATPFNQFGSKAAIMLALSARRIDAMHDRLADTGLPDRAADRVLVAVEIAAGVMLSATAVNRAVMAAIGASHDEPGDVSARSRALWAAALGAGEGLALATRSVAMAALPAQLAVGFRGVLSFWTAGEVSDRLLVPYARAAAAGMLLGFVDVVSRSDLLACLEAVSAEKNWDEG